MPRGGTAGGGKRGSSLNFHKPAEPSFLKRFKEKVTTIDDKFGSDTNDGAPRIHEPEDRDDNDDEKPLIVVLSDGDLTASEVEKEIKLQEEAAPPPETKIIFKKPTKRKDDSEDSSTCSTNKKTKKSKKSDKKLLSFDDDEEEENDFT